MQPSDPHACAVCVTAAFVVAGLVQSVWLYSRLAMRFRHPIDGGRTFLGKRLFGDNKTWRGFLVMIPATGLSFLLLGLLRHSGSDYFRRGLWAASLPEYGLIGCWTGLGFMLGELPNSFIKRQLGLPPGEVPRRTVAKVIGFVADQADSIAGGLLALAVVVRVPAVTWILCLAGGTALHWLFNLALFVCGAKDRAA